MAVPSVMLGQAMGRWGNFCNGEAFGSETTLPWRMGLCNSETGFRTLYVHPTFFYESFWNIIGFILINIFYKKRKYHGEVIIWYFSWYGLGRTFIELLRTDSLMIGPFRVSSLLSALLVIVLLPIGIFLRRLCKKYTEEGLLKEGEITTVKMLLYIFYRKKKGLPVRVKSTENHDATASENK
jgi:phosphatidylglycerol:prolipoprotein diacylglycerol transferase